jgi:hypothetical protein
LFEDECPVNIDLILISVFESGVFKSHLIFGILVDSNQFLVGQNFDCWVVVSFICKIHSNKERSFGESPKSKMSPLFKILTKSIVANL